MTHLRLCLGTIRFCTRWYRITSSYITGSATLAACILAGAAAPSPREPYPTPPPLHLYEARVVVTGTDMRSRPAGLAACLADVLVQVSGDPSLVNDPRAAALGHEANALVADFDYADRMSGLKHNDEQGSSDRPYYLTVRFNPAKIDETLRRLGDSPYTGSRPTLLPVVVVRGPRQTFVLTSDGYHFVGQPEAFAAATDRYFMKLRLPRASELADGVALSNPDLLLIGGSLMWSDTAHGWIADWDASWQGRHAHWGVSGVNYDEAFRNAVRGALGLVSGHPPAAE